MRKRYLILGVLAGIAGLLVVGGIAAAQSGTGTATPTPAPTATPSLFIQELAKQLNLDPATVQAAAEQAKQTALHQRLDDMVAKRLAAEVQAGRLTQAEADAVKSWWTSRPPAADKAVGGFGFMGRHGPRMGQHGPMGGGFHHGAGTMPAPMGTSS